MNQSPTGPLPTRHRSTENISKLAKLIDIRQRASLDEIANVIDNDHAVTGPLMERAYPKAPVRQAATVQMATSRVGINYIIVLLITDLVTQYVLETFQELAGMYLMKDDPSLMLHEGRSHVVATVRFQGKASGTLFFVFTSTMVLHVADRLLEQGEEMTIENMNAAVEHITGAIATKLEAGLNAGRLPGTVTPPEVSLMNTFPEERVPGGTTEEFYFRQGTHGLRVHLCVKPLSLGS
jgi:CheY-specific phosphatase CheX